MPGRGERPRRILFAAATPSVVGGAEAWAATAARGLGARGWEVALVHERPPVPEREAILPGGPVFVAGDGALPEAAIRFMPDIVLVNGLAAPALEGQIVSRWPAVLFAHSYYGTCATGTKRFGAPRPRACTRALGPGCLLLHYPRRCGGLDPRTMLADYRRQQSRHALLSRYRRILVASAHMREEYARHGIEASRVSVLPPPPFNVMVPGSPPPPPDASGRLLFLGRVTDLKGADYMVRAAQLASGPLGRPLSVTVAGDGPDLARVTALAARLDVQLRRADWVEGAERAALFTAHELLVMPSLWPEPFGMTGPEAGAFGVPAVAFATGGIPDWLTAGVNGELAASDPPTPRELAAAIQRALGDRERYARLSRGAWEAARRFMPDGHLVSLEHVLVQALAG